MTITHLRTPSKVPKVASFSRLISQIMALFDLSMVLPISFKVDPTPHDQLRLVLKIKLPLVLGDTYPIS